MLINLKVEILKSNTYHFILWKNLCVNISEYKYSQKVTNRGQTKSHSLNLDKMIFYLAEIISAHKSYPTSENSESIV